MAAKSGKGLVESEIEKLEQMLDELRVQAHLLKADTKKELTALEKKFQKLRRDVSTNPVKRAATKSATDVTDATRLLLDTVKDGFSEIRKSLKPKSKAKAKSK
jgi:F0F1-type ATP synthase membrane subunit b/b'